MVVSVMSGAPSSWRLFARIIGDAHSDTLGVTESTAIAATSPTANTCARSLLQLHMLVGYVLDRRTYVQFRYMATEADGD